MVGFDGVCNLIFLFRLVYPLFFALPLSLSPQLFMTMSLRKKINIGSQCDIFTAKKGEEEL